MLVKSKGNQNMILIDENVPKSVYTELKKRGYDVKHVIFIKRGLN